VLTTEPQFGRLELLQTENGALKDEIKKVKLKKQALKEQVNFLKIEVIKQSYLVKVMGFIIVALLILFVAFVLM
jgi:hypothetical protein